MVGCANRGLMAGKRSPLQAVAKRNVQLRKIGGDLQGEPIFCLRGTAGTSTCHQKAAYSTEADASFPHFLFALAGVTLAQDVTITNLAQLADMALSANYSLYIPWRPWQWRAYPTDNGEPWWIDCSQVACADLLSTSTNLSGSPQLQGVPVASVVLTRNILTGETILQPDGATNIVAVIPAPSGYQPGTQLGENVWVWREWQQVTNCLDCWGLTADEIPPPIVTLKTRLADAAEYSTYASNEEAEAEAAAAAQASPVLSSARGSGMMFMGMEDDLSCVITDETAPFSVVSLAPDGSGGMVLQWQSCPDHVYVVQKESSLTPTSSWTDVAWMLGANGTTSWDDTNIVGQAQGFYQVVRANPNTLNDGIPYGWAVTYGFDPFDPNLAWEDSGRRLPQQLPGVLAGERSNRSRPHPDLGWTRVCGFDDKHLHRGSESGASVQL
jgi:hypothetical protein